MSIQKRDILFKIKERDDCNHPGFHRDVHPYIIVFRGLQSERDAEIEQNGRLWMGTRERRMKKARHRAPRRKRRDLRQGKTRIAKTSGMRLTILNAKN